MTKQLTAFLENQAGRLQEVAAILAAAEINILSFNLADTTSFGVLRMVVSDPEQGKTVLREAGIAAQVSDVISVEIPSKPGSMSKLLGTLPADISVEYLYPYDTTGDKSGVILKLSDMQAGLNSLLGAGYKIL